MSLTVSPLKTLVRPQPPEKLLGLERDLFIPAPELAAWLTEVFISRSGRMFNPDHAHLEFAHIGCLWTNVANSRQMNVVAATSEIPFAQGGPWPKARHEQQLCEWFGSKPDFVITFSAGIAERMDDATWCALCEHELYHCAQKMDEFGQPKFTKDGNPCFGIRGHDVEEFVGVVQRYGAGAAAGRTAQLVAAAALPPLIGAADVSRVCGTCRG